MASFFAAETLAIASQGNLGFRRRFLACASKAAAEWHVENQEKAKGFDARVIEVTEAEYEAILKGEWTDFLPSNKLSQA